MKFLIRSMIICCALSASAAVFAQGRLIGVNGTGVYEISMVNASVTQIATLTGSPGTIGELTYDWTNNVMYMSSSSNQNLMTLNPDTGAWSVIGQYGLGSNPVMHGLEYHSGTGKLYAMSGGSSHGYHLYDVNKNTGAATLIGTSPLTSFHNLGYDSINNIMYMTNSNTDSLYTLDLATGQPTLVGALGTSTNPNALAFNHHTGTMYLLDNTTDNLYTLNLQTGAATVVGNLGSSNFLSLAYAPVPEPATMAALGLGLALVARRRRTKR